MFVQCLPAEVKEKTNEKFCKMDEKVGKVDEKVEKVQSDLEALKGQHTQPSKGKVFLTL